VSDLTFATIRKKLDFIRFIGFYSQEVILKKKNIRKKGEEKENSLKLERKY